MLKKMFDTGYITSEDYNQAPEVPMPEDCPDNPPTQSGFTGPALTSDFAQYAHDELIQRYGADTVLQGGLSVYTTIDPEDQLAAHDFVYGPSGYLPGAHDPDTPSSTSSPRAGASPAVRSSRSPSSRP